MLERCRGPEWDAAYSVAVQLPFVELHLHLDGSLSEKFIAERAAARGLECPDAAHVRNYLLSLRREDQRYNPSRTARARARRDVLRGAGGSEGMRVPGRRQGARAASPRRTVPAGRRGRGRGRERGRGRGTAR